LGGEVVHLEDVDHIVDSPTRQAENNHGKRMANRVAFWMLAGCRHMPPRATGFVDQA
jgi:hypothetical protein